MAEKIKNLNFIKIIFDIILSVFLVLMFNKNVISMEFHEIGGLVLCGFFIIHNLLNRKWIVSVSKKLFSKDLAFKLRFGYIIDFLLLISMSAVLVSGIFISKVVFTSISVHGGNWKAIHYFAAALSLMLVGIHVGLHWGFITGMFKKYVKLPGAIAKPLSLILVSAVVLFGSYSIVTSSFGSWLTAPFTASQMKGGQPPQNFRTDSDTEDQSSGSNTGNQASAASDNTGNTANNSNSDNGSPQSDSDKASDNINQQQADNDETGQSDGKNNEKGGRQHDGKMPTDGQGFAGGREGGEHGGGSNALNVILTFTSIIGVFSAITYYSEKLLRRKKRSQKLIQKLDS